MLAHGALLTTYGISKGLLLHHVGSLRALRTVLHFESDALAFSERLEAFSLDSREMNEYVRTVVLLDETETFAVVEPLDCTFYHFLILFVSSARLFFLRNPQIKKPCKLLSAWPVFY